MTENEAIEVLQSAISESEKIIAQLSKMKTLAEQKNRIGEYYSNIRNCRSEIESCNVAISALKEIQHYREIGTVEECREAVERQKPKKCIIDSCSDHAHYKCPSCGQIELSIYKHGFPRLGRITKYCENCGQALIDEN